MNSKFQKINIEDVIFFDIEVVRNSKDLIIDSKEYELFQKKTRDRQTEEYLSDEDLVEVYNKKAALYRGYNKIITIGVGYVKDGIVYIKNISGKEEDIIKEFCSIANLFKYCCSFNGIAFDLPIVVANGMKYYNIIKDLKDSFNPLGKKIWNLDMCLDLMEIFKGTHYYPNSLDEVCYHFGIASPKEDIDGSMVSETYYNGNKNKIFEYVKKDVFANINIFRKMQGDSIFENFVDRSGNYKVEDTRSPLEKLYDYNEFTEEIQEEVKKLIEKKKLTKKDRLNLFTILRGVYLRTDFINKDQDTKKVIAAKEEEINEFIEGL